MQTGGSCPGAAGAALWGVSGLPVTQGVLEGLLDPLSRAFLGLSSGQGWKAGLGDSQVTSVSGSFWSPDVCSVLRWLVTHAEASSRRQLRV